MLQYRVGCDLVHKENQWYKIAGNSAKYAVNTNTCIFLDMDEIVTQVTVFSLAVKLSPLYREFQGLCA